MKTRAKIIIVVVLFLLAGVVVLVAVGSNGVKAKPDVAEVNNQMPGMDMGSPSPDKSSNVPETEAPTVEIPQDKQALIGVKIVTVSEADMNKTLRLTGRIEPDEQMLFAVNTKVEGWIEKLYADYAGRPVKKGEPLFEIYSPELLAAQQELIDLRLWQKPDKKGTAETMLASDTDRLKDAARKRLKLLDISDSQIIQIEKRGKPIRTLTISSPVSGYVAKRYATSGMKVMPGEPLLDIADLSRIWVVSEVNESDSNQIKPGIPAKITLASMPGKVFTSKIDFVYPSLTQETRTLKIRCTLPNQSGDLKPQMFAIVEITIGMGKRLSVPDEAVMDTGERQVVYVDKGEGQFEPREVEAGIRSNGMREIIKGLKKGERVAASAVFMIDSEAQLKGVAPLAK